MSTLKFSFYNIYFDIDNGHYIYNTLSTALAQLDDRTFDAVKKNDMTLIDKQFIEEMLKEHFFVEPDVNEQDEYLYFYNRTRFGKSSKSLAVNFIPSYNCNLACPYCMQGLNKPNNQIEIKDIDKILSFTSKTVDYSLSADVAITKIYAHLYGGEPMLQKQALQYFCDGLKSIAEKYKCEAIYSMTSNMTILDDDMIKLIQKYNIHVQISVDGTKDQHDKRRIFPNGGGTYDTILKNLKKLQEAGLKDCVVLRLNIDKDNLANAEKIYNEVHEYSSDVYFGFLDTFKGYNDHFSSQCVSNEIYPEIVTKTFNDIYQKYGQPAATSFGKMSPCSINSENKYFIDPFLNVYKCEMLLNQTNNKIGFIDNDGQLVKTSGFYRQMNRTPQLFSECMTCKLLPLCAGGCAGKAFFEDGSIDKPYCMFTEQSLIFYLKDYIKRATT